MRKALLMVVMAIASLTACSKDRIISYDQLPDNARSIIEKYFDKTQVSYVKQDGSGIWAEYEVKFMNLDEVEFDSKGEVKSVDMKSGEVPSDLVPEQIRVYVASNFAGRIIIRYSVEKYGYEIELNGELEITFDKSFRVRELGD